MARPPLPNAWDASGMGWVSLDAYDEDRVSVVSRNLAAAIDAATFGEGAWDQVPAILSEAFPGSWGGLANVNFPGSRLNFLSLQNMEPAFIAAYAEHFAYVNPWNAYWGRVKGTTIAASEEVSPAQNFIKTEFYNDWLLPQNRAVAAAAMKLVGASGEVVNLLVHYPLSKSGVYDRAAVKVLTNIRGNLERSANLARLLRADLETAVAEADPPPLNWSTLNYVFWQTGGPQCRRSVTSPKRLSRSCARSMCWSRRVNPLPMRSARSA
jgi:hypothetical protein